MKRTRALILTTLLLLVGLPFLGPGVAATWTNGTVANYGLATANIQVLTFSETKWAVVGSDGSSHPIAYRTTDAGGTWSGPLTINSVVSATDVRGQVAGTVGATNADAYACFTDAGNVYASSTHDSGLSWGSSTVKATSGDRTCGVWSISSTTAVVTYGNSAKATTDGGATWGSEITVDAGCTSDTRANQPHGEFVVGKDTTHAIAVLSCTQGARACATADGGATWTNCQTLNAGINGQQTLSYVPGSSNSYIFTYWTSGAPTLYRTTNGGLYWTAQTPFTPSGGANGLQAVLIHPFDGNNWTSIACWSANSPGGTGHIDAQYYSSTDAGATWSGATTAYTTSRSSSTGFLQNSWHICSMGFTTTKVWFAGLDGDARVDFGVSPITFGASTPLAATATATWTGTLQGFDVDNNGDTVIVRSNGGEIRTYSGLTLGSPLAADTAAGGLCNGIDRVMSAGTLVGYVICTGGTDPTFLQIRTPTLGVPTASDISGACRSESDTTPCVNIDLAGFSEAGGDCALQIGRVDSFPITFKTNDPTIGLDRRQVAWAWSAIDPGGPCSASAGRVGVNMFTRADAIPNAAYNRASKDITFAGTMAEQICTGLDGSQFYVGAAGTDSNTKVYPFNFQDSNTEHYLNGDFGSPSTMPSAFGQANSIGCGGTYVIVRNSNTVAVLNRLTTALVAQKTVASDGLVRAATISPVAENLIQYAAWMDGGSINLGFASNLTLICTLTPPSGTFKQMQLVTNGPSLFVATSTTGARYQLGRACSNGAYTIPDGGLSGDAPIVPTSSGGFTIGDVRANDAFQPIGVGSFAGGVLWAIGVIGGMTLGGGTISGGVRRRELEWSWPFAVVGGVLGFFVSWGFGFLNTATVFGIIVVASLGLGFRFYKKRVSSDME